MRFVVPDLNDPMKHPKAVRRAVAQRRLAVAQAFEEHKRSIRPLLPPSLQALQETDLNDGLIRSLRIDPKQHTLELCLLCGDLQQGYADLTLTYKELELTSGELSLLCFIAADERCDIAWDEVDIRETDRRCFLHRIRWNTSIPIWRESAGEECWYIWNLGPEIELRFGGFELEVTPRPDRHLARPENVVTVVPDPEHIEGME